MTSVITIRGDALALPLRDRSVDAVVCDPPYGLEFMGVAWDTMRDDGQPRVRNEWGDFGTRNHARQASEVASIVAKRNRVFGDFSRRWAIEALRVAKPGAHLIAFGGTRTHHRLMEGLEEAGWEIRDMGVWLYRNGFPKSMDVGKAIAKAERGAPQGGADPTSPNHGNYRTTTTEGKRWDGDKGQSYGAGGSRFLANTASERTTAASTRGTSETDAVAAADQPTSTPGATATEWTGWGTALKPSIECWVLARAPLSERNVAANVLRWGTGALNIDGCRHPFASDEDRVEASDKNRHADFGTESGGNQVYGDYSMVPRVNYDAAGRWPTNTITLEPDDELRHFRFCVGAIADFAKAGADEKPWPKGTGPVGKERCSTCGGVEYGNPACTCEVPTWERNTNEGMHPTVKPIDLMRHLVRLVTPPGGVVLDQFSGSGTTAQAALMEGRSAIAVEKDAGYLALIARRLSKPLAVSLFGGAA